jgi:hypothetical protein
VFFVTNVLPDATKNALLDSAVAGALNTTPHLSLHTGFPPAGGNELTGGSPAYARQPHTWAAASGGSRAMSGTETFDVPAGTTVRAIATSDALTAGTQKAWSPAGASPRIAIAVPDTTAVTANLIYSEAHGLVAGNSILFWATEEGNAGLPAGLAEDTEYFVIAAGLTVDAFSVSTTLGGSALDITDEGVGIGQKFTPEVFAGQGTYTVSTFSVALPG